MKRITIAFVLVIALLTACTNGGVVAGDNDEMVPVDNNDVTEEILEDDDIVETSPENDYNATAHALDGINVNELFQMNLGEAIAFIKQNSPDAVYETGVYHIWYEGSCRIRFRDGVDLTEDGEIRTELDDADLEATIKTIWVDQELDVYKGISVGKTLDEINNNSDLLHKLEVYNDEGNNTLFAGGWYEYNGILIGFDVNLNDDMVCTRIDLVMAESVRGNSILDDRMI